jgi:hypothetical protein
VRGINYYLKLVQYVFVFLADMHMQEAREQVCEQHVEVDKVRVVEDDVGVDAHLPSTIQIFADTLVSVQKTT